MTIHDHTFNTVDPLALQTDRPILAQDFSAAAENLNYLFKLATGDDLPGGANAVVSHDHGAHGGPTIPLWTAQIAGQPARHFVNGAANAVPFSRFFSSSDTSIYLQVGVAPHPVVNGSLTDSRYRLWLDGNVAAYFQDGQYLTLNDTAINGRFLYKNACYNSDVEATMVSLWDPLPLVPGGGTVVRAYGVRGEKALNLFVPAWARRLTLLIPAACSLSASMADGERLLSLPTDNDAVWAFKIRLSSGDLNGDWQTLYPTGSRQPIWYALSLDLRTFEEGVHSFKVDLTFNGDLLQLLPVTLGPEDACLWFKREKKTPRPVTIAYFSHL